jgi:hypothetical protein
MAVPSGTVETYSTPLIFEDLANAFKLLSPTECPFQQAIGEDTVDQTHFEWPSVKLNAVDAANRVIEGEDAPATDTATAGVRLGNYTQISDKKVITSTTSEAVEAAAENLQKMAKQMVMKMKEMKRDMEWMLLGNVPAIPGSSGTARQTAGFPAFLRTNTQFVAGGANPTLSGTTSGYPNAGRTNGTTPVVLTEAMLNIAMQQAWTNGGDPSLVLVEAGYKRIISQTFTGNATRYKDTVDQKVINSIDFYESDFGTLTIVPTRFMPRTDAPTNTHYQILLIDPSLVSLSWLQPVNQTPLAVTGHNKKSLLAAEYGLTVTNEDGNAGIFDLSGS